MKRVHRMRLNLLHRTHTVDPTVHDDNLQPVDDNIYKPGMSQGKPALTALNMRLQTTAGSTDLIL